MPSNHGVGAYSRSLISLAERTRSGAYLTGKINDEEREDIVRHACPGAGACGGMYT